MSNGVYILGGYQTDFSRNWMREEADIADVFGEVVEGVLAATEVPAEDVGSGHVGNFAAELYANQGHLGAFLIEGDPTLHGLPTARHEAACASGSIALLAASAEIEAGRYDVSLVVGFEQMKTVDPQRGGDFLGTAAWYEREAKGVDYPFPALFGRLGDAYEERYGLDSAYLTRISEINYTNARRNPLAQTRAWETDPAKNARPLVGRIRIGDSSQITDGAAGVLLCSRDYAERYAAAHGRALEDIPRIEGWGHRTAPILFDEKIAESKNNEFVLPHTRRAIVDAFARAGVSEVWELDAIETHDCFTTSEYMAIDHFGLTAPGESWKAIEDGTIDFGGRLPVNPSGGLIGAGHPVGATGVRQFLDAYRQVNGTAGNYQVEGARRVGMLNIGGSGTTSVSFVVGRES
ncbi:MAG TPA: acetyl-CoA acetyltransferase [Tepidiformaceae bacterium]|nr:acetyl-CoA acetyltransferase [Tepidiformaceae bacterium]